MRKQVGHASVPDQKASLWWSELGPHLPLWRSKLQRQLQQLPSPPACVSFLAASLSVTWVSLWLLVWTLVLSHMLLLPIALAVW